MNLTFASGNCYGFGANGSGKSTFLKILSGEIEPTSGEIAVSPGKRISILKQDQFAFDQYNVLTTVIMGHKKLYGIICEKEALYSKTPFTDEDGMRASELEAEREAGNDLLSIDNLSKDEQIKQQRRELGKIEAGV